MSLSLCWPTRLVTLHVRSSLLASNAKQMIIQSHPRPCFSSTIWLPVVRNYRTSTTSQMLRFLVGNGRSMIPKPTISTESLWSRFQLSRFNTNSNINLGRRPNEWEAIMKLPLGARMKMLIKKYWYVAIPIHLVTCSLWFGLLYLAAKWYFLFENFIPRYFTNFLL